MEEAVLEPQTIQRMQMQSQHSFLSCCNFKCKRCFNVLPGLKLVDSMFLIHKKEPVLFAVVLAIGVVTFVFRINLNRPVGFETFLLVAGALLNDCGFIETSTGLIITRFCLP